MRSVAAAAAFLLSASAAQASTGAHCYVPSFLVEPAYALLQTAESVRQRSKLPVLIVSGSPSQVGGMKGLRSYPAYLEQALRRSLPDVDVTIEVRAKARSTAAESLAALPSVIEETQPALVVWQIGTVDTLQQRSAAVFEHNVRQGIREIAGRGADTVLLDMQYSPRTDSLLDYARYLQVIRDAAKEARIPLFDRYEVMRYWNVSGAFDLASLRNDGLYEKVHVCLGELLADFILRAAGLKEGKGLGG